jgi:hypothetical protein
MSKHIETLRKLIDGLVPDCEELADLIVESRSALDKLQSDNATMLETLKAAGIVYSAAILFTPTGGRRNMMTDLNIKRLQVISQVESEK